MILINLIIIKEKPRSVQYLFLIINYKNKFMDCVFGIKGKDFVLVCTDGTVAYSVLKITV